MKHFALIGYPLEHSYSKQWFDQQHFPDAAYSLCSMTSLNSLRHWVKAQQIDGFNVTAPYKQAILPSLDALAPEAEETGAVNCVVIRDDRLVGHNTDAPAFRQTLETLLNTRFLTLNTAYILGTGGAARAVAYALKHMGISYTFVSRTPDKHPGSIGYTQLSSLQLMPNTLIINATPVGMAPNVSATPWPYADLLGSRHLCYDLVYNPPRTRFLTDAEAQGAHICNGLAMLECQARLSWDIWRQEGGRDD